MSKPTRLDGYRAAAFHIEDALDKAQAKRPAKQGKRHLAAYRSGYFDGLVLAHCLTVFGEYPARNADAIKLILKEAHQRRLDKIKAVS